MFTVWKCATDEAGNIGYVYFGTFSGSTQEAQDYIQGLQDANGVQFQADCECVYNGNILVVYSN